jgi:hypothetical protein
MGAMERFLADYEAGRREGRYVPHALPDRTPYADDAFDLGLSSHFLVLYANLGLDFHLQSLREMLRICREVRIFPLLDLNASESAVLPASPGTSGPAMPFRWSRWRTSFSGTATGCCGS